MLTCQLESSVKTILCKRTVSQHIRVWTCVSTVIADVLAHNGARQSADTVIWNVFWPVNDCKWCLSSTIFSTWPTGSIQSDGIEDMQIIKMVISCLSWGHTWILHFTAEHNNVKRRWVWVCQNLLIWFGILFKVLKMMCCCSHLYFCCSVPIEKL